MTELLLALAGRVHCVWNKGVLAEREGKGCLCRTLVLLLDCLVLGWLKSVPRFGAVGDRVGMWPLAFC